MWWLYRTASRFCCMFTSHEDVPDTDCNDHFKCEYEIFCTMLLYDSVFKNENKKNPELSCHWVDFVNFVCQKNSAQIWVRHSQSGSNNDLRRLEVSQRLLLLQGICIRFGFLEGSCYPGRTEWYVPDPGEGRKVSAEAKWKIVDLPALQGVAGVALMGLVPGQDAAFMLRACWIKVVKPQFYHSQNNLVHSFIAAVTWGRKELLFSSTK